MKRYLMLFIITLVCFSIPAENVNFHAILKEIDNMTSFEDSDLSCIYTIVSEKPGEDKSVQQVRMFRRDREDKFAALILKPETKKGQGYLQVDENLWFYDPESRKFAHTSSKENFQDSEAKNSDFKSSSLSEDYDIERSSKGKLGRYEVYILNLMANNNEVTYPRQKLWVRKDNHLLLKAENYSLSERLMRTVYYPGYISLGKKFIPSKILIVDELKKGERSQLTIKDPSVSTLPDYVFTKSYIERVNR